MPKISIVDVDPIRKDEEDKKTTKLFVTVNLNKMIPHREKEFNQVLTIMANNSNQVLKFKDNDSYDNITNIKLTKAIEHSTRQKFLHSHMYFEIEHTNKKGVFIDLQRMKTFIKKMMKIKENIYVNAKLVNSNDFHIMKYIFKNQAPSKE